MSHESLELSPGFFDPQLAMSDEEDPIVPLVVDIEKSKKGDVIFNNENNDEQLNNYPQGDLENFLNKILIPDEMASWKVEVEKFLKEKQLEFTVETTNFLQPTAFMIKKTL
jgi:hypothetical protein